jgi:hypothetical protein
MVNTDEYREARREYERLYRLNNKEATTERKRRYRLKNKEVIAERKKQARSLKRDQLEQQIIDSQVEMSHCALKYPIPPPCFLNPEHAERSLKARRNLAKTKYI